ncbi:DUF6624 domain-containing protein [Parapedobacter sp. 10938]|uniref:DUF6624 domain-containing protein n=1 Tax=Parapedobacter flavus TaxID=3110225 RepID=UPI002DBF4264|nr:DUF6624 domain-containing protein [Parapedobacter sp. 10938]MEC3881404.1 DUF6624 domain-containing protein [Parapedobacter sp. 10938]
MTLFSCGQGTDPSRLQSTDTDSVPYDSLRVVLEEIYDADQGIKIELMNALGGDLGDLFGRMAQIDSVNRIKMNGILSDYGWLPQSKVGEKASSAIFFVVQHGGKEMIQKNLPALQKLASENEAKSTHAALMEDRLLMKQGKKQIYGTQASGDTTGQSYVWPVADPKRINELRKTAGFELTVEENAERLDAIYNPKQELPKK